MRAVLTYGAKHKNKKAQKYIKLSLKFSMFISIGSMFGLIGVSGNIVPAFLGKGFDRCVDVVSLLSVTLLFMAWANVIRTQILIPKKKDKVYIVSTLLGAIVNVIINTLLIKDFGAIGATVGTIFAEATVSIYQTLMIRKELNIKGYLKDIIIFTIAGIFMFLTIKYLGYILGSSLLVGVIQIFIGAIVYFLVNIIAIMTINRIKIFNKKG